MSMRITAETIDPKQQRYPTCGDWLFGDDGWLVVRVSRMRSTDSEFLVMIHEIIEAYLCHKRGIPEQEVTNFDLVFEAERDKQLHTLEAEPGDDSRAPYHREHVFAELIERLIANELHLRWDAHSRNVEEVAI